MKELFSKENRAVGKKATLVFLNQGNHYALLATAQIGMVFGLLSPDIRGVWILVAALIYGALLALVIIYQSCVHLGWLRIAWMEGWRDCGQGKDFILHNPYDGETEKPLEDRW